MFELVQVFRNFRAQLIIQDMLVLVPVCPVKDLEIARRV